jgi:hypothetical protein
MDRRQRAKEIFHAVLERRLEQHAAFLDEVCDEEQELHWIRLALIGSERIILCVLEVK